MTLTQQIITAMADGKPRSQAQLEAEFSLPYDKIRHALVACMNAGNVASAPVLYRLTAKGVKRSTWCPKTPEERLSQAADRHRRKVARLAKQQAAEKAALEAAEHARAAAQETTARLTKTLIAQAIANRHPLQMAWGAGA